MGPKERKPLALIVEDDADQRHLAAALIEETDLDVLECESAEAALSVMQRCGERILLVLVDIRLPGIIDGVDLAQAVRRHWPHTKVIVTSGDPGDRLSSLPKEAAYMDKPWRALDVLIAAEEALATRRAAA
jgi:DNA-binding NtrC family response regulator